MISVYSKITNNEINIRRLENIEKYNRLIQWGRRHPTRFIEEIFGIELLDYQKWALLNTWVSDKAVWVCSRAAGKTFLAAVYLMTKAILVPYFDINLMNVTAKQNFETFKKIENIAKKNISSLTRLTDVFIEELEKSNNSDGFTHKQTGHECKLFNGSTIRTVVGKADTVVGIRSNINLYDEAGKIPHKFFELTEPFTAQRRDFKTGDKNFDITLLPKDFSGQHLYISSAEDVSSHLWEQYCLCAKKMMMGIPGYFCADLNCEFPLHPKLNGKEYTPLLTQKEIDDMMKTNEAKALREYFNIFDTSGGTNSVVRRQEILRNEQDYLPIFSSENKNKHYVICYDPALQADNSFCLIGEVFKDPIKGWMIKIVNGINLIYRHPDGTKVPLRSPEQLEEIRKLLLLYNGNNSEYNNVHFYVDVGAGGSGRTYAEQLWFPWTDKDGVEHRGIIDLEDENTKEVAYKYPKACNICHMIEPKKYKSLMFSALSDMIQQDLIIFPPSAPRNSEIEINENTITLTQEEMQSLIEVDLVKEEIINFIKTKTTSGTIVYNLSPDKKNKMHDDRAFCLALLSWHLYQLRNEDLFIGDSNTDWKILLQKQLQNNSQLKTRIIPFQNLQNPFKKK